VGLREVGIGRLKEVENIFGGSSKEHKIAQLPLQNENPSMLHSNFLGKTFSGKPPITKPILGDVH
jgi:hypothetical protein